MSNQELQKLYGELQALNDGASSLGQYDKPAIHGVHRFNEIVGVLAKMTNDTSFNSYTVTISRRGDRNNEFVQSAEFKQNVYTVTRMLHENYLAESSRPPSKHLQSGEAATPVTQTFQQNQNSTQSTKVSIEFNQTIIVLTETLTRKEDDFDDDTPEKGFIEKMKSMLSGTKNTIDVIKLVMTLAAEFGLTVQQVLCLIT